MGNNISENLESLIKTNHPDDEHLNNFIKASEEYEKLVKEGLTTKRGFNLMTIGEILDPVSNFTYSQPTQKLHS